MISVRIWPLHCSLGNQDNMKAGIAGHPAEREVRFFVCERASGSWYAGLSAALDQGIVGETQLYYRQANKPRVRAEIPYHTITPSPIPCLERLNLLT